jgi:limonene-1,2-epoxide hydrolase
MTNAASPEQIIRDFLRAWGTDGWMKSFDRYIHPECVWKNTGFPDAVGKPQVMSILKAMVDTYKCDVCHVELLSIASNGDTVLTERVDRMVIEGEPKPHETPVMGAFRVKDGLIHYYADYFDASPFLSKASGILATAK